MDGLIFVLINVLGAIVIIKYHKNFVRYFGNEHWKIITGVILYLILIVAVLYLALDIPLN